jgi:hypothetical protein
MPLTAKRNAGGARHAALIPLGLSRLVSMLPGEITLALMLCAANSEASARAIPTNISPSSPPRRTQAAIGSMVKNRYGRILFFTGDGAFTGGSGRAHALAGGIR